MVEWHFASINNRWTKRALASAGFGYPAVAQAVGGFHRWKPIYSVADLGGYDSAANQAEWQQNQDELRRASQSADVERASPATSRDEVDFAKENARVNVQPRSVVVGGVNKPLFHVDLTAAVQSAIYNIENRKVLAPEEIPSLGVENH